MTPRPISIQVPGSAHRLEGRLRGSSEPLAIIAPPHPLYGGTIGNPVVRALEDALSSDGLATMAFNFRGTGESDGEPSGELADARQDYLAAASALPNELACFAGYSFGAVTALACAVERGVPRVWMIAPPMALLDPALLARYTGELVVVVGSEDEYLPARLSRDLFGSRANTRLELLDGIDHYFLGSAVPELRAALGELTPG